jgi:uncharacterized protein
MKIKRLLSNDDELRSFCTCVGGVVKAYQYDYATTIDGIFAGSENTNFSLVNRLHGISDPIEYGVTIAKAANIIGNGLPILQRLGDLLTGRVSSLDDIATNRVQPSLQGFTLADIGVAIPKTIVDNITYTLKMMDKVTPGIYNENTLVYAPVLEMCWPKFQIDSHMQTNIPGLYVIGDVSGHVRGVIQAVATGMLVADTIKNRV